MVIELFNLFNILMIFEIIITVISTVLIVSVVYIEFRFKNRKIFESIKLAKLLKIMIKGENDLSALRINKCTSRSTVVISENICELHVPTKRLLELKSQVDIMEAIRRILESQDFRKSIMELFPQYLFETTPDFKNDEFILKGQRLKNIDAFAV